MLIAHISDFHIFADRAETRLVRPDAAEAARKVVDHLARSFPDIDAVMLTGDVADGGSDRDYALVKSTMEPIKAPVFVVPGNHDSRPQMRNAFQSTVPFEKGAYLNFTSYVGALRIIGLDTLIEGKVPGALAPETLDFFEAQLEIAHSGPTYVLLHHPPFPSGIEALDEHSLIKGGERFGQAVSRYTGSLVILSGHIHRPYQSIWHGALAAVGGSPAFQVRLDLTKGAPEPGLVAESYCYFVHKITGGDVAIHRQYVSL